MRVLLDTHMLIWSLEDSPRLPAWARAILEDPGNECWASSASVRQIAITAMIGKVRRETGSFGDNAASGLVE